MAATSVKTRKMVDGHRLCEAFPRRRDPGARHARIRKRLPCVAGYAGLAAVGGPLGFERWIVKGPYHS